MTTRHGSIFVVVGAFLSILIGGFAYLMTESLLISLGTAAVCLLACAVYANHTSPLVVDVPAAHRPSRFTAIARSSLSYITLGALAEVWGGVWYAYMSEGHPPAWDYVWYACYGVLGSGLVLLLIGLLAGRIGRAARTSELPPPEAMPATRTGSVRDLTHA